MVKLRTLRTRVDLRQSCATRWRTNYSLGIFVASLLVLFGGGWPTGAAYGHVDTNPGNLPYASQRVIPAGGNLSGTLAGLKIVGVASNGAAARAGLKHGDVLIAYNNHRVNTEEDIDAEIRVFMARQDQTGKPPTAELSFYRDGDMTVKTIRVSMGRLGIDTREWTFAGALVEEAIVHRNDYLAARKYVDEAVASGQYTGDQVLHMRMLSLNNEEDADKIRQQQVDQLYRQYLPEKLRIFANYDLVYHKRYRAGAAIFERYLKINRADVATELSLALCYIEIEKYDEVDALLAKILARPHNDRNAPTEYSLSALLNIRARMYMGRRQYDRAQEQFQTALKHDPDNLHHTLGFLYCAARLDISGEKRGAFAAAYIAVSARSEETEELMNYHIDALRAFVLVNQRRISSARAIADKWGYSADGKRYVPILWRRFPNGSEIIDNWNSLLSHEPIASGRPLEGTDLSDLHQELTHGMVIAILDPLSD
jgi:tetratricopeptide (TPR) repeat protein